MWREKGGRELAAAWRKAKPTNGRTGQTAGDAVSAAGCSNANVKRNLEGVCIANYDYSKTSPGRKKRSHFKENPIFYIKGQKEFERK